MNAECPQCAAIARELIDAYSEALRDDRVGKAAAAVRELIGGGEDELVRAEQLLATFRAQNASRPQLSRAGRAFQTALVHWALSGHKPALRAGFGAV
ncbi:MAG: hypothetical protein JO336_17220 [Acidobacteriia bacterium]|nr:hypothetical protein [Terriglobia bacterium]